jgi:hypothetical protein
MQTVTCMPDNEENYVPLAAAASSEGNPWPYCRQVRYHLRHRGPLRFDRGSFEGAPDIVKTQEWFGSGGQASRLVVASQKFRQAVVVAKWQGLVFQPIELIG